MPWKDRSKEEIRVYNRAWYARQTKEKKRAIQDQKLARKRGVNSLVRAYKKTLKCSRCQESDPACLDFHHPKKNKEISIGSAMSVGWNFERVMKEIRKCVVLCANCHRKHHSTYV